MNQKYLKNHLSWKHKYKPDGRKCNPDQKWDSDKCRCECKKHNISVKTNIFGIPLHVAAKMINIYQILWVIQ